MDIGKREYFEIFRNNFNYPIVETKLGIAIKMNAFDAFIYSNITGAGYLDNEVMPFTPKGLLKVFYNAFDFKFVTGIFDNTFLKYTPLTLNKARPYLFRGVKYIIPIEFNREIELQEILENYLIQLSSEGIQSTDFIIQRIEKSKKGNGMEPLMEFLTAEYFKAAGFIVETQIPLAHNIGSPDFAGYKIKSCINHLRKRGYFPLGFHLIELGMLSFQNKFSALRSETNSAAIVGEAKTSTKVMTKQLQKYLQTNLFNSGFEIYPQKNAAEQEYFGLVTLDDRMRLKVIPPDESFVEFDDTFPFNQEDYFIWLENYMKYYLISNLSNDYLGQFYWAQNGRLIGSIDDIVFFINSCPYEDILDYVCDHLM